jgi:hypothetical protein
MQNVEVNRPLYIPKPNFNYHTEGTSYRKDWFESADRHCVLLSDANIQYGGKILPEKVDIIIPKGTYSQIQFVFNNLEVKELQIFVFIKQKLYTILLTADAFGFMDIDNGDWKEYGYSTDEDFKLKEFNTSKLSYIAELMGILAKNPEKLDLDFKIDPISDPKIQQYPVTPEECFPQNYKLLLTIK